MSEQRKSVIISIPLVWGVRNFMISGVTEKLESLVDVYYATPEIAVPFMRSKGILSERIILLKGQKSTRLQRWVNLIIRRAHLLRFPTRSDEVFKPILPPSTGGLRNFLLNSAARIFSVPFLFNILERLEQRTFVKRIDPHLVSRIREIQPSFALSTSYVVDIEWSLFRMLHAMEVPIYTHILSFDNMTSRGYLPIRYFDAFLVWNKKMADELQHIYAIPTTKITISGTPQFDFHTNQKFVQTREWTEEKLGIKPGPYLVYCANHLVLTPDEPQLVENIIAALLANDSLKSYQVLLRLHPMDDYDRWNATLSRFPSVRVSHPWAHRDKQHLFWGEPTLEDLTLFSNTLRYSSLVFNIASSISIDAAIFDKPVICVGFSSDPLNKYNSLYYDFHFSHHYGPIINTGATPLATDLTTLVDLAVDGIQQPQRLSAERKNMVKLLCGEPDGQASDRILNFMIEHIN